MKLGTKLCVHCGCILAMKVGEKWVCQKCGEETTPEQEAESRRRALREQAAAKNRIDLSRN